MTSNTQTAVRLLFAKVGRIAPCAVVLMLVTAPAASAQQESRKSQQERRETPSAPGGFRVPFPGPTNVPPDGGRFPSRYSAQTYAFRLGFVGAALDATLRKHLKLADNQGYLVTLVLPDSIAQRAGLLAQDIVLKVNGKNVNLLEFNAPFSEIKETGESLQLEILRNGEPKTLNLEKPRELGRSFLGQPKGISEYWLGLSVEPADNVLKLQLKLGDKGLIVIAVSPDSPAKKADLRANDILLTFQGAPITSYEALDRLVDENKGKTAKLEILRDGDRITVEITPTKRPDGSGPNALPRTNGVRVPWLSSIPLVPGTLNQQMMSLRELEGVASQTKDIESLRSEIRSLREEIRQLSQQLKDRKPSPPDR